MTPDAEDRVVAMVLALSDVFAKHKVPGKLNLDLFMCALVYMVQCSYQEGCALGHQESMDLAVKQAVETFKAEQHIRTATKVTADLFSRLGIKLDA